MWSDIALSGEVAVSGLSLGSHYFVCSVPNHCERGNMRIKVNVLMDGVQNQDFESDIEVKDWEGCIIILKREGSKRSKSEGERTNVHAKIQQDRHSISS